MESAQVRAPETEEEAVVGGVDEASMIGLRPKDVMLRPALRLATLMLATSERELVQVVMLRSWRDQDRCTFAIGSM